MIIEGNKSSIDCASLIALRVDGLSVYASVAVRTGEFQLSSFPSSDAAHEALHNYTDTWRKYKELELINHMRKIGSEY